MPKDERDCITSQQSDNSAEVKQDGADSGRMAPRDRRAQLLAVLEASGTAMRGVDVWRTAKLHGATFERRTATNYLGQLLESGDVLKVDSDALGDGDLVEIDRGERGHFIAASVAAELRESGNSA